MAVKVAVIALLSDVTNPPHAAVTKRLRSIQQQSEMASVDVYIYEPVYVPVLTC